jgi:hypothetical protein
VALILTLGILAILTLAIVAFVVTTRIEHLATSHNLHRTMARQYVDVGLNAAMNLINSANQTNSAPFIYPVQGWSTNVTGFPHFFEQDCFAAPSTNPGDSVCLFRGGVTNLLPITLAKQAELCSGIWVTISETNELTGADGVLAGRVSFLVANLSGMADVHALNSNRWQALGEPAEPVYATLTPTSGYRRYFRSQADLLSANHAPLTNLIPLSYDTGPEVYFTNSAGFGTHDFAGSLFPRYNINRVTNDAEVAKLGRILVDAGVPEPDAETTAWNVRNYQDTGRLPLGPAGTDPLRPSIGVKDLPLINKVAIIETNTPMAEYAVAVEVWYPFVPNDSPANAHLWVGIYTSAPPRTLADPAASPPDFFIDRPIPVMQYNGSNEFFVARSPGTIRFGHYNAALQWEPEYISDHPIWIWPRIYMGDTCVDEALVTNDTVRIWTQTGCYQFPDPRANHLLSESCFINMPSPALGTTNSNCTIPSLPLVHANAPMQSAGEIRYIYAPGLPGGRITFANGLGACRDRLTVRSTNTPAYGLFQANTPYTNVWQAILCDIPVGWTNTLHVDTRPTIDNDAALLETWAACCADALRQSGYEAGTARFEELFPLLAAKLLTTTTSATNEMVSTLDATAVCGDILAGIADRVSFRQNLFLVIVCGQRLSPLGRVLADQRAAMTVVRDAFTGRWVVDQVIWLTE